MWKIWRFIQTQWLLPALQIAVLIEILYQHDFFQHHIVILIEITYQHQHSHDILQHYM